MLRQFAFLVVVAVSAPAQDGGIVRGTVTNSATRAGLAGVEVTLWTQQAIRYNATSDERGDWQISGMKPGRYSSRFEKSGFIEPPRANPFDGSSVVVGAGGAPIRLDAELSPLATLRGRVLNPDGTPAPDIEVRSVVFASVKTGADGEFELTGVRPGSYTLRAMPKTAPPKSSDDRRTEIVPTYFPSTIDSAEAAKIVVRGGEDLSGFEIRLQASPVYRVRGVVLDDAGQPLANANVQLLSRSRGHVLAGSMSMGGPVATRYFLGSDSLEAEEAATLTRADGSFEFPSVHPGDWLLRGETDPKRDSAQTLVIMRSNPQDAAVTDHDLVDLQIRFPARFTLRATLDWGDNPPPKLDPRGLMMLMLIPENGPGPSLPQFLVKDGDNLKIDHVAEGRYRIMPMPGFSAGYYVASILLDGRNILGKIVELTAATSPLSIVCRPHAATIRGTVDKGEGATVLFWPQSAEPMDLVRAVQVGAGGTFELPNVAPGDYDLLAVDQPNLSGQPAEVIRTFASSATPVRVDEATSPVVALPLTHLAE